MPRLPGRRQAAPGGPRGGDLGGARAPRGEDRQALRRLARPPARVGALGRGDLDAGDDGHDPQPRAQRRRREGARRAHGQPALRRRLVPAPDPDVRRSRRRDRGLSVRAAAHRPQETARCRQRHRPHRRGSRRADRDLQEDLRRGDGWVPAGRSRPAHPRGTRSLRLVGHPARPGLPARARDPGRHRHRCQRAADGLRQQGRELRYRRGVHPQPRDRRDRSLRRVPDERPGRGRRRRHPHPRAARADGGEAPAGVRAARADDAPPRGALPRHAGRRVHGRRPDSLHAADALREAHGGGGRQERGRDGGGGADHARGRRRENRPDPARPAPAPDDRPRRALRGGGEGPQRLAWGSPREDRVRRRRGRGAGQGAGGRDPRPLGDDPRRHQRDDLRAGDPHRPRRHDLPRGGRRPWNGQAVHRRLRGTRARPRRGHRDDRRPPRRARRRDHDRRRHRPGDGGLGQPRAAPDQRGLPDDPRLVGRDAPHEGARQRRHARAGRPRRASSAPRGSASAVPSTCSSARTGSP